MSDEFALTLNSPITEEQWDMITDVDFDNTNEITFHTKHGKEVKFVKASAQPEPCEDAVSRQKLLNDLKELKIAWKKYPVMAEQIKGVEVAIKYVETIPSVTPKRKTGKWVIKKGVLHPLEIDGICSKCGYTTGFYTLFDFCPNCGAKMNGGEQE